jgi:thiaminase (transcriptional activator TenA)
VTYPGGSFSSWLRECNRAAWDAMVSHRFCRDVAEDTLPEAALVRYLRFEHAFVRAAVRTFAYALAKADDSDDQDRLIAILQGLAAEQDAYFRRTFARLDRDGRVLTGKELPAAARQLSDGVLAIAASEPFPEILAAMTAAEWMYLTWCEAAEDRQPRREAEAAWVALHTAEPFRQQVAWLLRRLDVLGPALPPKRRQRCALIFGQVLALEIAFHNAPYNG